jgi:hypothetical protein
MFPMSGITELNALFLTVLGKVCKSPESRNAALAV